MFKSTDKTSGPTLYPIRQKSLFFIKIEKEAQLYPTLIRYNKPNFASHQTKKHKDVLNLKINEVIT